MNIFKRILSKRIIFLALAGVMLGTNILNLVSIFRSSPHLNFIKESKGLFFSVLTLSYPTYFISLLFLIENINKYKLYKILLRTILFIAVFVISASLFLHFLEARYYANFVFSKFGVYLPALKTYSDFQIFLLVISFFYHTQKGSRLIEKLLSFKNFQFILIVIILYRIIISAPALFSKEAMLFKDYVFKSKDKKQEALDLGDFSLLTKFVAKEVPEEATIFHPLQSNEYPMFGNQALLRYFVFPRKLVSPGLSQLYLENERKKGEEIYSILSRSSDSTSYYPDYRIMADTIKVLRPDGRIDTYYQVEYDSQFVDRLGDFKIGIIKHSL